MTQETDTSEPSTSANVGVHISNVGHFITRASTAAILNFGAAKEGVIMEGLESDSPNSDSPTTTAIADGKHVIVLNGLHSLRVISTPLEAKEYIGYGTTDYKDNRGKAGSSHLLVGGTAGGKTVLAHHLCSQAQRDGRNISLITMGEAEGDLYGSIFHVFAAIHYALELGADFIAIDALRSVYNELGGALKGGGISRSFDGFITSIDQIAKSAGVDIIITVNPSDDTNKQAGESVFQTAAGSVSYASLITALSVDSVNGKFTISTKTHRRSDRNYGVKRYEGSFDERVESDAGSTESNGFNRFLAQHNTNLTVDDVIGPDYISRTYDSEELK